MAKNTVVFGICPTQDALEAGIGRRHREGFRNTHISVLFAENVGTKDFAREKATKAPEGASALGWLAGATQILEDTGARDIASAGETTGDIENTDKPMVRGGTV